MSCRTMYLICTPSPGRPATWPFEGAAARNVQSTVRGHSVSVAVAAVFSFRADSCRVSGWTAPCAARRTCCPSTVVRAAPEATVVKTRSAKSCAAFRSEDRLYSATAPYQSAGSTDPLPVNSRW